MVLVALGALVVCRALSSPASPSPAFSPPTLSAPPSTPSSPPASSTPSPAGRLSEDWHLTVYYTAVESFHRETPVAVSGCPTTDCAHGSTDLGTYPGDFVDAVRNEGTGRITSGRNAGSYLNWSYDVGFWLDSIAATSWHTPLRPFVSSASGDAQLPRGATFHVASACTQVVESVESQVCRLLHSTTWIVDDEFTPGLGGSKRVDVYIGEENQEAFESTSPRFIDVEDLTLWVDP